jgi:hypothetical protein
MGFLSVLGVIFLFLICKFLWNHVTYPGKQTQTHAPVVEPTITSDIMRKSAITMLADKFGCEESEVEYTYKRGLYHELRDTHKSKLEALMFLDTLQFKTAANSLEEVQAASRAGIRIGIDDTTSGIMHTWIRELATEIKEVGDWQIF